MSKKKKYTQEQKNELVRRVNEGQSVSSAAKQAGAPLNSAYQWVAKAKKENRTNNTV